MELEFFVLRHSFRKICAGIFLRASLQFFTGVMYECLQLKQATGRTPGEQQGP